MKNTSNAGAQHLISHILEMQYGFPFYTRSDSMSFYNSLIKESEYIGDNILTLKVDEGEVSSLKARSGFSCTCRRNPEFGYCLHTVIHAMKLQSAFGLAFLAANSSSRGDFARIKISDLARLNSSDFSDRNRLKYYHLIVDDIIIFLTDQSETNNTAHPMVSIELVNNDFYTHCNCGNSHAFVVCSHILKCFDELFKDKLIEHFEERVKFSSELAKEVKSQFGLDVTEENFDQFTFNITKDGWEVTSSVEGVVTQDELLSLIKDRDQIISSKKSEIQRNSVVQWAYLLQIDNIGKSIFLNFAETVNSQFQKQTSVSFLQDIDTVTSELIRQFNNKQFYEFPQITLLHSLLKAHPNVLINTEGRLSKKNISNRIVETGRYDIEIKCLESDDYIVLELMLSTDTFNGKVAKIHCSSILDTGEHLIIPSSQADYKLIQYFSANGELLITKDLFKTHGIEFLLKLLEGYPVSAANAEFPVQFKEARVDFKVGLKPAGDIISVTPTILINGKTLSMPLPSAIYTKLSNGKGEIHVIPIHLVREFHSHVASSLGQKTLRHVGGSLDIDKKSALTDLWLGENVQKLKSSGYEVTGMEHFKGIEFNEAEPVIKRDLYEDIDWFGIKVNVYYGNNRVSIDKLAQAIKKGQRTIKLADGTLGVIDDELIDQITSLTSRTTMDAKGVLRAPKSNIHFIEELAVTTGNKELLSSIKDKIHIIESFASRKPTKIPKTIKATLRSYQQEGFEYLQTMEALGLGAVLGDEMGLGKTIQSIVTIEHLRMKYGKSFQGVLIICPVTLISNWENEFNTFCPKTKVVRYYGKDRVAAKKNFNKGDIVVTSLQTFRLDPEVFKSKQWQLVIVDEAQNIKNPNAKSTVLVNELSAKWRLALTGTPVENSAMDAFSIFSFANPGILGTMQGFNEFYNNPINKGDREKAAHLKKVLSPLMIRRLKTKVLSDLPPKTESVVFCTMGKLQRDYYEAYRISILDEVEKLKATGSEHVGAKIISGIQALRQICNHPSLAPTKIKSVEKIPSVKLELLVEQLHELIPKHKSLIFSTFAEYLKIVKNELNKESISNVTLTGGLTAKQRDESIKAFKNPVTRIDTFLITTKAGGAGLNLTEADYVFILDPWWNPAAESQAIDRTHRLGQKNPVTAFKYICKDTVEDKILQLQKKKLDIFEQIVSEGDELELRSKISMEDLEFILK